MKKLINLIENDQENYFEYSEARMWTPLKIVEDSESFIMLERTNFPIKFFKKQWNFKKSISFTSLYYLIPEPGNSIQFN